jgi:acetyl esterase/lipase
MSKYTHLSEIDPAFAPLKQACDEQFKILWDLPAEQFVAAWRSTPPALPEYTPTDLDITHQMIPVKDGTLLEIRVYKAQNVPEKALLYVVAHGGGWALGGHDVEEAMNRQVAAHCGAVVVSVDYRMSGDPELNIESALTPCRAPKFRFPYALKDCLDVLKWVRFVTLSREIQLIHVQCQDNASVLGIDSERIVVAGGSAGGNIVSSTEVKLEDWLLIITGCCPGIESERRELKRHHRAGAKHTCYVSPEAFP